MANFYTAYKITMAHEGGYANDPVDRGGETWKGVARNFWPKWEGWIIVDQVKASKPTNLNQALSARGDLQKLVEVFYKSNFWDVNRLDDVVNQNIANEMFDIGVNMGVGTAAKFLQEALNLCNRNQVTYPDLLVDGQIGPVTLGVLNNKANVVTVFNTLNLLKGERYINIMRKSPDQEKFWNGWVSRIEIRRVA